MADREAQKKIGLVLSGGGARGAYQAGVLQAIAEIAKAMKLRTPFPIISGVSAGAINASYLAASADDFYHGATQLVEMWRKLTTPQIFRSDAMSLSHIGWTWARDVSIGNLTEQQKIKALLDTAPLRRLLKVIPFEKIDGNIKQNMIEALAISAVDYATGSNVTFVQGNEQVQLWRRVRRYAIRDQISIDHVMASSAIPLFFPPVKVHHRYYGDGCLRNSAPLSPAVHLGCNRLLIISVKKESQVQYDPDADGMRPSVARVLGLILNGVLLDAIDTDVERLARVNETMALLSAEVKAQADYQQVDYCWIRPSQDLSKVAEQFTHKLPRLIRFLLGGLGSTRESAEITSYLLFDPEYCGSIADLGYEDGMRNRDRISELLADQQALATAAVN